MTQCFFAAKHEILHHFYNLKIIVCYNENIIFNCQQHNQT